MKIGLIGPLGSEKPVLIDSAGRARDVSALISDITSGNLYEALRMLAAVDPGAMPIIDEPLRYGVPVADIGKMVCIGLNYRAHEIGRASCRERDCQYV